MKRVCEIKYMHLCILLIVVQGCCTLTTERNWTNTDNLTEAQNLTADVRMVVTDCLTPENKTGFCVDVYTCVQVLNKIGREPNEYIRKWACGPRDKTRANPVVCCEPQNIRIVDATTTAKPVVRPVSSCGYRDTEVSSRIWGGEPSMAGEFPWIVKLLRKNEMDMTAFSCTGVLIHPKVVLTAAHCLLSHVLDKLGTVYAVVFDGLQQEFLVSSLEIHSGFNRTSRNFHNDIGIIILKEEIHTPSIRPICILEENFEATEYYISGWGQTQTSSFSSAMMKAVLPPFSWKQCYDKYLSIRTTLNETQICAGGEKNKDSCTGDSGGPLMVVKDGRWFAAGIVSFGVSCGRAGWPGVYTNIPSFAKWIREKMEANL